MILEATRPVQGGLRQERKLEAVSNNLANAETVGYKKDTISFDARFKAQINKDFEQGSLRPTDNPLDLALSGEGFFKIETPEGIRYTRNGNFLLDADGILVDQNGHPVMGQGGAIVLEGENVDVTLSVNQDGEIFLGGELVDVLDVVTFEDLRKMKREAQNMLSYEGDTLDEIPAENAVVQHRALEHSNVMVVDEMVRMIDYHRMFETFTKSILTFDEVDSKVINEVGKPR